jgi:formyl-CoA transferase
MAVPVDHPSLGRFEVVNQAVKLSRTPSSVRTATPEQGEHTDEVLAEIGYGEEDIRNFHENGVV